MKDNEPEKGIEAVTAFLNDLGLFYSKDVESSEYWQDVRNDINRAIGRELSDWELSDPMSEAVVDFFFSTLETAKKFLVADLPRLVQLMVTMETIEGFPEKPCAVAEAGGGPGIVSLWLASKNPDVSFVVFDQSENALSVGRTWARHLGISNISYERATYSELGTRTFSRSFDLVLGLASLNLNLIMSDHHLCADGNISISDNSVYRRTSEFVKACKNMLASSGVLYFSQGSFNDLGLLGLFKSFRENELGFDWRHSFAAGEGEGAGFSLKAMHLFLIPDRPSVFENAREDLVTLLFSAKMTRFSDKIVLGHGDFESWLSLLSDGTKLADIMAEQKDGRVERFTIYVKAGILGFFSSHSEGLRSGFIYNAASFESAVDRLSSVVENYKKRGVVLTRCYWYSFFKA